MPHFQQLGFDPRQQVAGTFIGVQSLTIGRSIIVWHCKLLKLCSDVAILALQVFKLASGTAQGLLRLKQALLQKGYLVFYYPACHGLGLQCCLQRSAVLSDHNRFSWNAVGHSHSPTVLIKASFVRLFPCAVYSSVIAQPGTTSTRSG